MYWMLLPPSANAGRHIKGNLLPQSGYWGDPFHAGWDMVLHLIAQAFRMLAHFFRLLAQVLRLLAPNRRQ